jgi:hypothetical protein
MSVLVQPFVVPPLLLVLAYDVASHSVEAALDTAYGLADADLPPTHLLTLLLMLNLLLLVYTYTYFLSNINDI